MKILIISPFLPYSKVPHAGGKFTYEIIKTLSKQHEIHLMARIEPNQRLHADEMKTFCKKTDLYFFKTPEKSNILSILKIIVSYLILGIKANELIKTGSYDLIHVEHTQTGLIIKKRNTLPSILMAHDVVTKPAKRRYLASNTLFQKTVNKAIWILTEKIEGYISCKFSQVFLLSSIDRNILLGIKPSLSTDVIPYPIDLKTALPYPKRAKTNTIMFCGAMNRHVNVDAVVYFAEKVFPSILNKMPDCRFYIVGNKPGEQVKKLAEKNQNITVTGFVEDLEPFFLKASVFVSPLFTGGGIIVKNLQAMSYEIPVVTTTIGNEGLSAKHGEEILIADTPNTFADHVLNLLHDQDLSYRIASRGKTFVLKNYSLESVINKLDHHYRQLE